MLNLNTALGVAALTIAKTITTYSTSFTASNGDLATVLPEWTRVGGNSGDISVSSNQVNFNSTDTTGALYLAPALAGNNTHAIEVKFLGTMLSFACLRAQDASNFLGVRRSAAPVANALEVYTRVGGTLTLIARSTETVGSTDVVRLEDHGDGLSLVLKINGTPVTVSAGSLSSFSAPSLTTYREGLISRSSAVTPALDDFMSVVL